MNITYLQQPKNSRQCGQCCLTMVWGKSMNEIIDWIYLSKKAYNQLCKEYQTGNESSWLKNNE